MGADENIFLTTDELAKWLKISRRTLERMRVDGTGPRFIKAGSGKGSRVLYRKSDIIEWTGRNAYNSTSEYAL